jgi:GT2 family glycosyltransferase
VAVHVESGDRTGQILADAHANPADIIDLMVTVPADTGFADAVHHGVRAAQDTWDGEFDWLWVVHDDCAPEPDCLAQLVAAAKENPTAGVLGPLSVDWVDPRLVVEAGVSIDASGHRQAEIASEWLPGGVFTTTIRTLSVGSAGALIDLELWEALGGFDRRLPLLREDVDFGWRANRVGRDVLSVPTARMRHARAVTTGQRVATALGERQRGSRARLKADRAHGVRTYLVNISPWRFGFGLIRLVLLCLLRGLGFVVIRQFGEATAEFAAIGYLLSGRGHLHAARLDRAGVRARNRITGQLLTSRGARLRNVMRNSVATVIRRRVAADAALGRLPETAVIRPAWVPPEELPGRVVPTKAVIVRSVEARPGNKIVVPIDDEFAPPTVFSAASEPVVLVEVTRAALLWRLVLSPPIALVIGLTSLALLINVDRLGLRLHGGQLLPMSSLGGIWQDYLAVWHNVDGGSTAAVPSALGLLGIAGAPLQWLGGPAVAVSILLIGDVPLAGLFLYLATRRVLVSRWLRALVAALYALLPAASAAVSQGRLATVVLHVFLPVVLAGIASVVWPGNSVPGRTTWLSGQMLGALAVTVVASFFPLFYVVVVALAALGILVTQKRLSKSGRRIIGLCVIMTVPPLLTLPWTATVLRNPALFVHTMGVYPVPKANLVLSQLSLSPPGSGSVPYLGGILVAISLLTLILRPGKWQIPGVIIVAIGMSFDFASNTFFHDWDGDSQIVSGAGMSAILLAGMLTRTHGRPVLAQLKENVIPQPSTLGRAASLVITMSIAALCVFSSGAVLAGREGELTNAPVPELAADASKYAAVTGGTVLQVADGDVPARLSPGRLAQYLDDEFGGKKEYLTKFEAGLRSADPVEVRSAVAKMGTAGIAVVVLPQGDKSAGTLLAEANNLLIQLPPTTDGRTTLAIRRVASNVSVVSPRVARVALTDGTAGQYNDPGDVTAVPQSLPEIGLHTSAGAAGRLVVVTAAATSPWRVTIDGTPVTPSIAWDGQLAVEIPTAAATISITIPTMWHTVLLFLQAAIALFVLLTAIPGGKHR